MQHKEKFNLLENVNTLTMPVLMIVGELDNTTPYKHQNILFQKIPGQKELHMIKDAPHTFRDTKHLKEVYNILNQRIKKI
jgi:fermentation-respiration switch protein FrsA (DUF1100 family)